MCLQRGVDNDFEPEKIAPHGNLGGSIPRKGVYKDNVRALDTLVASE